MDLANNLPSPQELYESEELESIGSNANFRFLVQTGYEHIGRIEEQANLRAEEEQVDAEEMEM